MIKNSKGEFIARQDGDDISFRDRLESQMNYLVSNNLDGCTTQAISTQNSKILHNKSKFLPKKYLIKYTNNVNSKKIELSNISFSINEKNISKIILDRF